MLSFKKQRRLVCSIPAILRSRSNDRGIRSLYKSTMIEWTDSLPSLEMAVRMCLKLTLNQAGSCSSAAMFCHT